MYAAIVLRSLGRCGLVAGLAAIFLVTMGTGSVAVCTGQEPEQILDCLRSAYASADSAAYCQLLAEDFRFHTSGPDSTSWNCESECRSTATFFRRVGFLQVTFADGWHIVPGSASGTWVIDKLTATLQFKTDVDGKTQDQELTFKDNQLRIRRTSEGAFVISDWLRPSTSGQIGPR